MTTGNAEMMEALQALASERGMSSDQLLGALADALETAYQKMPDAYQFAWVTIDPDTFDIRVTAQDLSDEGDPIGPEIDFAAPHDRARLSRG